MKIVARSMQHYHQGGAVALVVGLIFDERALLLAVGLAAAAALHVLFLERPGSGPALARWVYLALVAAGLTEPLRFLHPVLLLLLLLGSISGGRWADERPLQRSRPSCLEDCDGEIGPAGCNPGVYDSVYT